MIERCMKRHCLSPLIRATILSFGLGCTLNQLGKDVSGDLKTAKILRGSKARNVLFLTVIGTGLLMIGGVDAVSACSLSSHCYAQWYAQWHVWPGITGDREEYGVKSTMNTVEISDSNGSNNFVVHAQWIVHNSGKWVEIGIIQGDFPGCPTLAEHTEKYYWTSWDGSVDSNDNLIVKGECMSILSVGSSTVELSDTNKDGNWIYKVGSTTINTKANNFGKGYLQIGGESTDADNILDGDFSSLQYYDTEWRTWTHHRDQVIGTELGIEECSASSANVGDDPSCG